MVGDTPADPGAIDLGPIKAKRIGDIAVCTRRSYPFDPWRNLHSDDIDKLIAAVEALREQVAELKVEKQGGWECLLKKTLVLSVISE